tara:strand:- start:869 stop:1804 length:936 start_codon:yes stop_codon:yes gene_type:complete
MSILADCQFTLENFREIKENNVINELDPYTIKIINKIAKKVGAPSYIKTPVFKKNRHYKKEKYKNTVVNDSWDKSLNFKKTELHKSQSNVEAQFDKVRLLLNKLTTKNYKENLENIIFIIKFIEKDNKEYLEKIGKTIFEIGSKNKFWCGMYAKLYRDIIKEFPIMSDICKNNFKSFKDIFNTFNIIDASENYNLFCEYNKQNETRRSLSKFFVLCSNYDVISKKDIEYIIKRLIGKIYEYIEIKDKINYAEEITENLKIMIENFDDSYKNVYSYNSIVQDIENLSSLKCKDYPSLNNKILFNLMDIQDMM